MRPEVIVPTETAPASKKTADISSGAGLDIGMAVRIIREPHFGAIGKVVALPVELKKIETEALVRVLQVELEDKEIVALPRANVEIIEE
jgi:hypothetical protein